MIISLKRWVQIAGQLWDEVQPPSTEPYSVGNNSLYGRHSLTPTPTPTEAQPTPSLNDDDDVIMRHYWFTLRQALVQLTRHAQ